MANVTQSPRVLIVDDEALLSWALAEHLRSAGYAVETASTAKEALEAFQRGANGGDPFDAVLLDYRLPDFDGTLPLLADFRTRAPKLAVLMMSAYGTPELIQQATEQGAVEFFSKPFEYDDVVAELARHIPPPGC